MQSNHVTITLTSDTPKTPRIMQVAGMFDVSVNEKNTRTWEHNLPLSEKPWGVGLIVGPSGSGKSVLARELWGDRLRERWDWDADKALIDGFNPKLGTGEITSMLTAVGLGTVPAWVRPYRTLSNGEQFRADMARALTETDGLTVVDEFTSVVDRQVAKIVSHCVQKTVRRKEQQFVAVTCHYDVEDWLQPDWVYDVQTREFRWRLVQPHPPITLNIREATRADWHVFAYHHYLNHNLATSAKGFVAEIEGRPVAYTSYIHFMHPRAKNIKMAHRIVVLPDYQGLGIAGRICDWLGQYLYERGYRYHIASAHPAMIGMLSRSKRWRCLQTTGKMSISKWGRLDNANSRKLALNSFSYVPARRSTADRVTNTGTITRHGDEHNPAGG